MPFIGGNFLSPIKFYLKGEQNMTEKKQKELFPWNFIVIGILICCVLTIAKMSLYAFDNPVPAFFAVMVVSVLCGYIPMKIAYEKQTKHKRGIYILSVIAMSMGSLLISIPAIIWACCDKKIEPATTENNKNNPNTVQPDTTKDKEKSTTYGWQNWE